MYILQNDEKEKIIQYLIDNKEHLKELLSELDKEKNNLLEKEDQSFHEDIEIEFIQIARMIIAEEIGRNTGLPPDSILFILESININQFKEYIK